MTEVERRLLTREEVARILGLCVRSLRQMEDNGEIKPILLNRKAMYSPEYIQNWIRIKQNQN